MPLRTYTNDRGHTLEELVMGTPPKTVERNGQTYRLDEISGFAFVGLPAPTMGDEILRGYKEQEQKLGSRFRTRLPADRIKRTWKNDKPDAGDQ